MRGCQVLKYQVGFIVEFLTVEKQDILMKWIGVKKN